MKELELQMPTWIHMMLKHISKVQKWYLHYTFLKNPKPVSNKKRGIWRAPWRTG